MSTENIEEILSSLEVDRHFHELLHDKLIAFINRDPIFKKYVHSHKSRFKEISHLREKIIRKNQDDLSLPEGERKGQITVENIKSRITDFCGIRILHLYLGQFEQIHRQIMSYVESNEISLYEPPKAYTSGRLHQMYDSLDYFLLIVSNIAVSTLSDI